MMMTLRALAALLSYPSEDLKANAGQLRDAFAGEQMLTNGERQRLGPLLARFERDELLDLQATYSELFDRSRSLSLHLFEHVHGDSRERGQAMIDLARQYMDSGFLLEAKELPDFIPVFLEYASCLPMQEARDMLGQPAHVFAALAERLDKRGSDYAGIFDCLMALADSKPDAAAIAQIDENTPKEDPATIDEEWEEAPVSFMSSGAHEMGGPTGVVAKIRASNRPVDRETGQ
jgi:nitrate reductase molybdenum cofactor assembly chaperone NarJ/NarW